MFILIDIYIFIHVSGCVGMSPSALLCSGACNADKTALATIRKSMYLKMFFSSEVFTLVYGYFIGLQKITEKYRIGRKI
jgi:hypothetical protein